MKLLSNLLLFSFLLIVASCSSDDGDKKVTLPEAKPIILKSEFDNKLKSNNNFAFDLFRSTCKFDNESNIVISPLSVNLSLGMVWNGADGETKTEMQKVLHNTGYTAEQINEYAKTLQDALTTVDPSTQFTIANSIWNTVGFEVQKSFININKIHYNSEVRTVDFSTPDAVAQINKWCSDNTKNKIPTIVEEIPGGTVMYLINAIYFKGIWRSRFDKKSTYAGSFNAYDRKQDVKMMTQRSFFPYAEDGVCAYLELPYGNNAFSMVVMLPQEGKTVQDVVNILEESSWKKMVQSLSSQEINLHIPRFRVECKYDMEKEILPDMGMKLAFDSNLADFSKITGVRRELAVSTVTHKTYIEVNEEGTEAAAVTSTGMMETSVPQIINYIVDKPFLFAIKEKSTGIILFIGKIEKIVQ